MHPTERAHDGPPIGPGVLGREAALGIAASDVQGRWLRPSRRMHGKKGGNVNLILPPKDAAKVLRCDERTVRNRIRRGAIKHVIVNGGSGTGVRYLVDLTKEYGIGGD